jgi:hypothetical protein
VNGLLPYGDWVRANWGRWIVDCTSRWCAGAMQVYPGQVLVTCGDCGTTAGPLIWPADPDGVETILLMRPDEKTRNWLPGETLQDLLVENACHGILMPGIEPDDPNAVTVQLLATIDDRVVSGLVGLQIRSDARRHQIEEATYGVDHTAHRG